MLRAKFFAVPLIAFSMAATPSAALASSAAADAESTVAEAEAAAEAMVESWNIVQNATKSPEHNTLAKAIVAADLTQTLSAPGPFTLFAPTDQAFAAVPPMTNYLMNPVNKPALAQVLTYHVVPGKITAEELYAKIEAGGGKATLTTVEGQTLTFTEVQGNIKVDGTQGSTGYVTQPDVDQSNGIIHVVNGLLLPELKPVKPEPVAAAPAEAAAPATEAAPASADEPAAAS